MISEISKLRTLEEAKARKETFSQKGKKVVLTNGCFDLLHTGHLFFLKKAADLGDALFIGLNGDKSVHALKGPTRPVQSEMERAYLMSALDFVDTIFIFQTKRLTAEIETLQPDIYSKAGDYDMKSINQEEKEALIRSGSSIKFLPFLKGYSTTKLIQKIQAAANTF